MERKLKNIKKVGIIGQGFVGSAIREGLDNFYDVLTFDIDPKKSRNTHKEVVNNSDIVFVCVPTPMRKSGKCDTRILESAIRKIEDAVEDNSDPVLVIKSTIPPGTTDTMGRLTRLSVCFSPEFLTEANSFEDFKNQTRIIIGGPRPATGTVKRMFRKAFPDIPIVKTGTRTAEMVKYFTNCFLATKVTFANQMYDICQVADIDYDKVIEYSLHDKRIGRTHLLVPGPDGDRGFGGHCFPKDLSAMISYGSLKNVDCDFLKSVDSSNNKIRANKDWEDMKGRAVSDD